MSPQDLELVTRRQTHPTLGSTARGANRKRQPSGGSNPPDGDDFVLNFRIKSSTEASETDDPIEVQQTNLPLDDFEKHMRDRMAKSGWHNVRRERKELFDRADPA